MSFPRYPGYKDSGVEWLGNVPGHWSVKKIGHVADLIAGFAFPSDRFGFDPETGIPLVRGDNVTEGWLRWGEKGRYWPRDFEYDVRYLLAPNDILVQMDGSKVGKNWALVGLSDLPALLVQRVTRIRVDGALPKFVYSFIANEMFIRYVDRAKTDPAIPHITMKDIADYWITLPPLSEQTQIAAFLDRETAKIDALVGEQRRLMALLKEKRQAVISHAVTRGLNPDAPMKPSGNRWLGDVPAHWEVGPLKRFWSVTDCKHVTAEFVDDGIPLASIREVQSRWVKLEDAKCTTEYFYELLIEGDRQPLPGDLIFSRNATVGEVAQVNDEHPRFAMGQDVVLLRKLWSDYSSDYLQHVIHSPIIVLQLANMMIGSTFKRINVEEIRSFFLPSPPPTEQVEIATFLENEVGKFDTLTTEAQRAIDLLQERRTALISAAVTGQIDVRGAVQAEVEKAVA